MWGREVKEFINLNSRRGIWFMVVRVERASGIYSTLIVCEDQRLIDWLGAEFQFSWDNLKITYYVQIISWIF